MQVNRITGKIDWTAKTVDPVWRDGLFDDGRVCIRSERVPIHESCKSVWYDPEQDVACCFLGYILNRENVARLLPFSGKPIACTLSSGFDINLLLHFLAGTSGQPVATYTIGGEECDEIPRVKKITPVYPSVSARYAHVAADKLDHLPDIVWHLEGYLFERGIYLMDELGKLLRTHQEQFVFTGEGGDGLFSSYKNMQVQRMRMQLLGTFTGYIFYRFIRPVFHLNSPEIQVLKKLRRPGFRSRFSKTRDLNLKKLGILLNAHGVMGLNPLLSFEYRAYCKALGKNLSRNKQFYKGEIRKTVHREIAGILIKIGGSTDIWYNLEPYLHLLEPLLQSDLSRQLINRRDLRRIRNHPKRYQVLIHQLFYIYTFKELFLSGKYDFSKLSPEVTLTELFESSQPA